MTEHEARKMVMEVGDCRASITMQFTLQWPHVDGARSIVKCPDCGTVMELDEPEQPAPLKVYMIVGLYDDNRPCAIFFYGSKVGEFEHGVLTALGMSTSLALQHGCPIEKIAKQWTSTRFPPEGFSGNPNFPRCTSLLDLAGQWLKSVFCDETA